MTHDFARGWIYLWHAFNESVAFFTGFACAWGVLWLMAALIVDGAKALWWRIYDAYAERGS